jgi:predicted MPP superfamily phosphohydrolase
MSSWTSSPTRSLRRRTLGVLLAASLLAYVTASAGQARLPLADDSVRFAVIGDSGTGGDGQHAVAEQLAKAHARFPFEFAIMLGDNLYGRERPRDYVAKFERPYKPLLKAGVKFYAALGNHDDPTQRLYEPFNMGGERYYTFTAPRGSVRFYALDSNYMDARQIAWLEKELERGDDWKLAFFHHPLYSSGDKHGPDLELRERLEPLFVRAGVSAVFTGHEHFYERIKPQQGITYFIAGSSAKLRRGDIEQGPLTAKGFDRGYTFMLVEIAGDRMHFETISDKGTLVDSGVIARTVAKTQRTRR